MKTILTKTNTILFLVYLLLAFNPTLVKAQTLLKETRISDLPTINMTKGINVHFISPEPIQLVDLSTSQLTGDLPSSNLARVKIIDETKNDSLTSKNSFFYSGENIGVITIIGQSFMAQYKAVYSDAQNFNLITNIQIQPEDMQPLELPTMKLSNLELKKFCYDILRKPTKKPIHSKENLKLKMLLNNVYVLDDYIFLDVTFGNKTNLAYNIDAVHFSIEDKKIYKATNNQNIPIEPVEKLYDSKEFKKTYHNIYVFKKFTFPNSKILKIRLLEEQILGRVIEMKIKYSDILNADTL